MNQRENREDALNYLEAKKLSAVKFHCKRE